jgi:hypothetical protein
MKSNVVDQPAKAAEDRLNMRAYADALTDFVKEAEAPLTIALQGEWGSGKTSLMNSLKASLVDAPNAPFLGVWINTWQYALMSNPEEAILNILMGISGQVSVFAKTSSEDRKRFLGKLATFAGSACSQFFAKQFGVDFKKNIEEWNGQDAEAAKSGVENLKGELAAAVKKALENAKDKRGFLFFIDDLDRIDPPVAVQILELLKNVFDLENCIFILAIDYGVVVKGLKPKFGAMTPENEREFRSFFDKIIQLPFAMPVNSYKIDDFLMDSLVGIGYLDAKEKNDSTLCEAITYYALQSVGRNPRSLKRLINYLSLIRLLIERTPTQEDDSDFKSWKDILFALVSLQVQYPKVYEALLAEPDFPSWSETFEQKWRLPALEEGEKAKLDKMEEFDETWEQMLFRFCRRDTFLEARAINISRLLNRIKARIADAKQPVGDTIDWLLRLSAVTNVKSEPDQAAVPENFNRSEYLKHFRWHALKLRPIPGKKGWETPLPDDCYLSSWQARVQTNLLCELWAGKKTYNDGTDGFLTAPSFHILHDGKSFQLKIGGEFWGNWPKEKYKGIDFTAEAIQTDLAAAEAAFCAAWAPFGIDVRVGKNIGHNEDDIWWNHVCIPFKDLAELVSDAFSQKLHASLAGVAAAFASLLKYRIPVNQ